MTAAAVDVSVGSALVLDGDEWRVERGEPHTGRVQLVALDGTRQAEGASRGRQPKSLGDLTPHRLELVRVRLEHLAEVRTGFRSGDRLRPGPGEPLVIDRTVLGSGLRGACRLVRCELVAGRPLR
ncbi:hypothetical protein ABT063_06160 [Streptomyces sp. NPDC002838]|uniref:hypothetical protein n=1 Tax=Streptomyces sp. NPDC002838 TaxID=3154436 RepID=UPI0033212980